MNTLEQMAGLDQMGYPNEMDTSCKEYAPQIGDTKHRLVQIRMWYHLVCVRRVDTDNVM